MALYPAPMDDCGGLFIGTGRVTMRLSPEVAFYGCDSLLAVVTFGSKI